MARWKGWIVEKRYYKVAVEADSWETAKDMLCDMELDTDMPDNIDWDIYDLEEVTDE